MNPAEEWFANASNKLIGAVTGPGDLMRSLGKSLENPIIMPALLGLGAFLAFKMISKN